jgi:hypothetical protein
MGLAATAGAPAAGLAAVPGAMIFPSGVTRIARDMTIRTYATARPGARIVIPFGVTLRFGAGFEAPRVPLFEGGGQVTFDPATFSTGYPEWWGARTGDPDFDCAPAINACIVACPITELAAGAYYIARRLEVGVSNRTVRGRGLSQAPYLEHDASLSPDATQIVLASPSAEGMLAGVDQPAAPPAMVAFVTLEDFVIVRATAKVPLGVIGAEPIANPASGILPCPTGLVFKWVVNGHFNRVMAIEHSIGFYIRGCVESYWNNCSALRATSGADLANDNWSGFFLDYNAAAGYNGGNASIYITACRAFSGVGQGRGAATYTSGVTSVGGFVDLFITQLETGLVHYGLDLEGSGARAIDLRTEDLQIQDCVLDSPVKAGLRLRNAGGNTAVEINGLYVGLARDCGAVGLDLEDVGGVVAVNGAQIIGGGGNGTGLSAVRVNSLAMSGNIFTDIATPISLQSVGPSKIGGAINAAQGTWPGNPAVALSDCQGCKVEISLTGGPKAYAAGVSLDVNCRENSIDATMISAAVVGGGGDNKVLYKGRPWGGGRTFGKGNMVTGAT